MRAMILEATGEPLRTAEVPDPGWDRGRFWCGSGSAPYAGRTCTLWTGSCRSRSCP